jgi:hypothetical protein
MGGVPVRHTNIFMKWGKREERLAAGAANKNEGK